MEKTLLRVGATYLMCQVGHAVRSSVLAHTPHTRNVAT